MEVKENSSKKDKKSSLKKERKSKKHISKEPFDFRDLIAQP